MAFAAYPKEMFFVVDFVVRQCESAPGGTMPELCQMKCRSLNLSIHIIEGKSGTFLTQLPSNHGPRRLFTYLPFSIHYAGAAVGMQERGVVGSKYTRLPPALTVNGWTALISLDLVGAVRSSFASTTNKDGVRLFSGRVKVTTEEDMKKKQQGNVEKKQQRAPRFAPELDGLHCFETLVSY
ncbi:hypothetical protein Gotur_004818 [Gossypium turneri]